MTENSREIALNYLEEIQRDCLYNRFGDTYETDFKNLHIAIENNFDIEQYFASQPSLKEGEKAEIRIEYEKLKQTSQSQQTKFENIQSFTILKTLFDTIENTAKRISHEASTKPLIGTAFSKEYNAFATKVPDIDVYLILFEGELFTLSNLLAKLIALSLPDFKITEKVVFFSFEKNRIANHVKTNSILQKRFSDLVYNAIYLGQPNKTQQYYLPETFGKFQYELLNSLELFVVGHEYGHIYGGHLNEVNIKKRVCGNKEIEIISPNWEMEYEADFIGLRLLLNSLDGNNLFPICFLGPELFFTFLDLDERAYNLHKKGIEKRSYGSDTHPPTTERRNRIRQIIKNSLPKNQLESYNYMSDFLENVIESLWENYKKQYANSNKAGRTKKSSH